MEVLAVFLKLGLTSFGGPVAHIGYFRREFVERRRWLDDATFTDLVGLCQFLPGLPAARWGFLSGCFGPDGAAVWQPGAALRCLRLCCCWLLRWSRRAWAAPSEMA
ncbi:chromate transporter [Streptomyces sp. L7]